MKKTILIKISPIILTLLLLAGLGAGFPIKSYAASVSVYPSSDTVYVGDSVTVTVTIYSGEIYAYSGYVDCDGLETLPKELFDDGINACWAMMDRYGNGFAALAMGFSDVDTEIKKAEGDEE